MRLQWQLPRRMCGRNVSLIWVTEDGSFRRAWILSFMLSEDAIFIQEDSMERSVQYLFNGHGTDPRWLGVRGECARRLA